MPFSLRAIQHAAIYVEILLDHAVDRKAPLNVPATGRPFQLRYPRDCLSCLLDGVRQKAGLAVGHELGHAAPVERDHGRAAGHRFHRGETEGLGPADRVKQRIGTAQELVALGGSDTPGIGDVRVVQERFHFLLIVLLALDGTCDHQPPARVPCDLDGLGGAGIFVDAAQE